MADIVQSMPKYTLQGSFYTLPSVCDAVLISCCEFMRFKMLDHMLPIPRGFLYSFLMWS
jgi:hypothetical protein